MIPRWRQEPDCQLVRIGKVSSLWAAWAYRYGWVYHVNKEAQSEQQDTCPSHWKARQLHCARERVCHTGAWESVLKRLRQNEDHVSPPCCRRDLCTLKKVTRSPGARGWEWDMSPSNRALWGAGGRGVWLCGDRAPGLCAAPGKPARSQAPLLGRHFILVRFVVWAMASVGWYFSVKDRGISLNVLFVREGKIMFFLYRKHCCVVEVARVASSVSACSSSVSRWYRIGLVNLCESNCGVLGSRSSSESSWTFHGYLEQRHLISDAVKRLMCSYSESETCWWWFLFICLPQPEHWVVKRKVLVLIFRGTKLL